MSNNQTPPFRNPTSPPQAGEYRVVRDDPRNAPPTILNRLRTSPLWRPLGQMLIGAVTALAWVALSLMAIVVVTPPDVALRCIGQ